VRWPGDGNIKSRKYTIFYSGTENNRHENGFGFLINDSILPDVDKFTTINEGLGIILIKEEIWDIALLNCYAPTEDKNNDVKSEFYERLENAYDSLPGNKVKIIVGNLNAQIGC